MSNNASEQWKRVQAMLKRMMVVGSALLGVDQVAWASSDLMSASRRIAELRAEVEAMNSKWDELKKSVEAETQAGLNQVLTGETELKAQRTQVRILGERVRAAKLRLDRGMTVTQADQPRLKLLLNRMHDATSGTLSIGRQVHAEKWIKLKDSFLKGESTSDEVAGDLAELLIEEVKLTRGIHYVREELSWKTSDQKAGSEALSASQVVEGLRIGGVQAWIFTPDGRVGRWRGGDAEPDWIEEAAGRSALLRALQEAREKKSSAYLQLATRVGFAQGGSK